MIFVDSNVFMYLVGRDHPLLQSSYQFFDEAIAQQRRLVTSSEVLQELLHAYIPVNRFEELDRVLTLIRNAKIEVWSLEYEDLQLARHLADSYRYLGARDLCHLACCQRRGVKQIKTFDKALASVSEAL